MKKDKWSWDSRDCQSSIPHELPRQFRCTHTMYTPFSVSVSEVEDSTPYYRDRNTESRDTCKCGKTGRRVYTSGEGGAHCMYSSRAWSIAVKNSFTPIPVRPDTPTLCGMEYRQRITELDTHTEVYNHASDLVLNRCAELTLRFL